MATIMSVARRRLPDLCRCRTSVKALCTSRKSENMNGKELVLVEHHPDITMIGINRPEARNCINTPTADALLQAFKDFNDDADAKVAILYGVGGNFCAGYDLKEIAQDTPTHLAEYGRGPMGPTRYESRKPVIAAVEGFAVAGGLELALWCDLRVIEENAVMGVFCRRFGVPLIDGGTVRLPAIVGLGRALDLILTGRPINAKEAFEWGMATQLVAVGTAIGGAYNLAQSLLKFPQECMLTDRHSALYATFSAPTLHDALKFEHKEGIHVVAKESVSGAQKFTDGIGRHGKFHLHPNLSNSNKSKL